MIRLSSGDTSSFEQPSGPAARAAAGRLIAGMLARVVDSCTCPRAATATTPRQPIVLRKDRRDRRIASSVIGSSTELDVGSILAGKRAQGVGERGRVAREWRGRDLQLRALEPAVSRQAAGRARRPSVRPSPGRARRRRRASSTMPRRRADPAGSFPVSLYQAAPRVGVGHGQQERPQPIKPYRRRRAVRARATWQELAVACLVPAMREAGPIVYRIAEGRAMLTPVTIGVRREGRVEITEGLAAGDTVVVNGHVRLRDRTQVEVVPPAAGS